MQLLAPRYLPIFRANSGSRVQNGKNYGVTKVSRIVNIVHSTWAWRQAKPDKLTQSYNVRTELCTFPELVFDSMYIIAHCSYFFSCMKGSYNEITKGRKISLNFWALFLLICDEHELWNLFFKKCNLGKVGLIFLNAKT